MFAARPVVRKALGATALGCTGGALYYNSFRNDEGSLIVPTLQATTRVVRLAGTCAMMVADYKLPAVGGAQTMVPSSQASGGSSSDKEDDARSQQAAAAYWEKRVTELHEELQQAQEKYSTNNHPGLDMKERVEAKKEERKAMHEVAERLAEAEEQLVLAGSSSKSLIHRRAAKRLLDLCHVNRGVYIKVGQHLANLDYLLPNEYIEIMSALYDDNPLTSFEDVCHVVQEDLGALPHEVFDRFDPIPIASASLAQVHVAYSKEDGRKLAVKVQHRGLRETSKGDIFSLVTVVRTAEKLFEDFSFGWLADEIAPNLPKELDFQNEARNAELAAEHIQKTGLNCVIPKIHWDKTSERVLTMDFEEGFKANDTDSIEKAGLKKRDVAKLISSVFASQVFESGHVHCDPHEANVLLRSDKGRPQMVLVDHGLYKSLDPDFRLQYAKLWKSLMLADLKGIQEACDGLGIRGQEAYSLFAGILTARPFDEVIERSKRGAFRRHHPAANPESRSDQAIIRGYAQRYLPNIMALLAVIPRQMILLLKMNDCLRHIDYKLGSPANTLLVTGQYAAKAIYQDSLASSSASSWLDRFKLWWSYFLVNLRIRTHETSLWWLQTTGLVKL